MAKSLQEQLMGAGLVDKDKAKKIKKEQRTKRKQTPKGKELRDEAKERVEKQNIEKRERDRELNRLKKEELDKRAVLAQVKQLIQMNEIKRTEDAQETFQFAVDKKIKKIYVDASQLNLLSKGRIAIASLDETFYLIPVSVADKILERDDSTIAYYYESSASSEESIEDDPYKDFVVPDDLMW